MFDSLTDNGKGVLKLIIKEQINQIAKQKEGPTFKGKGAITIQEKSLVVWIQFYHLISRKLVLKPISSLLGPS